MHRCSIGAGTVEHQVILLVFAGILAIECVVARLGIALARDLKDVLARNGVAPSRSIGNQAHPQGGGDGVCRVLLGKVDARQVHIGRGRVGGQVQGGLVVVGMLGGTKHAGKERVLGGSAGKARYLLKAVEHVIGRDGIEQARKAQAGVGFVFAVVLVGDEEGHARAGGHLDVGDVAVGVVDVPGICYGSGSSKGHQQRGEHAIELFSQRARVRHAPPPDAAS